MNFQRLLYTDEERKKGLHHVLQRKHTFHQKDHQRGLRGNRRPLHPERLRERAAGLGTSRWTEAWPVGESTVPFELHHQGPVMEITSCEH